MNFIRVDPSKFVHFSSLFSTTMFRFMLLILVVRQFFGWAGLEKETAVLGSPFVFDGPAWLWSTATTALGGGANRLQHSSTKPAERQ